MCTLPRVHNEETCLPPGVHICSRDLKVPLHTIAHVHAKLYVYGMYYNTFTHMHACKCGVSLTLFWHLSGHVADPIITAGRTLILVVGLVL